MPGVAFHDLHRLWRSRERRDEYFGSLVNAYLAEGGEAIGVRAGRAYIDVGTLQGYREAVRLLGGAAEEPVHPGDDARLGPSHPSGCAAPVDGWV